MNNYEYTIETGYNLDILRSTILSDGGITTSFSSFKAISSTDFEVIFESELTPDEKSALDNIIDTHNPVNPFEGVSEQVIAGLQNEFYNKLNAVKVDVDANGLSADSSVSAVQEALLAQLEVKLAMDKTPEQQAADYPEYLE